MLFKIAYDMNSVYKIAALANMILPRIHDSWMILNCEKNLHILIKSFELSRHKK